MRRIIFVLAVSLAFIAAAKGDTLRTFAITDIDGRTDGAHNLYSTLSGLITIDTTTGVGLYGYIQYTDYGATYQLDVYNPPVTMSILSNITNWGCVYDCLDFPNGYLMQLTSNNVDGSGFTAWISTPTSLIDYMGGKLCYGAAHCASDASTYFAYSNFTFPPFTINGINAPSRTLSGYDVFFRANLTLVSEVQTPEPSTWLLLGTGALGMIGTLKRKAPQE